MLPQWPAWQPVALQPNCALHIFCEDTKNQASILQDTKNRALILHEIKKTSVDFAGYKKSSVDFARFIAIYNLLYIK